MDKNYTHILFVLDNSASMRRLKEDAIGGFNAFLEEQKKVEGKLRLDTILFSQPENFCYIHEHADIQEVDEITGKTYTANGHSTALLDALGKGIDNLGEKLRDMPEQDRPAKVLVNIYTDGLENSSREFNDTRIKQMIDHQEQKYGWEFVFLASDIEATNYATHNLGIGNVSSTEESSRGINASFRAMSKMSSEYRTSGNVMNAQETYDASFEEEEDEDNS